MGIVPLNRTLEQELLALARGASLECLACGEFVLLESNRIECPECDSRLDLGAAEEQLGLGVEAG